MNNDDLVLCTLDAIALYFALHFGTYTRDDTVKISEVFDVIKEFTERFKENIDAKN